MTGTDELIKYLNYESRLLILAEIPSRNDEIPGLLFILKSDQFEDSSWVHIIIILFGISEIVLLVIFFSNLKSSREKVL